MRLLKLLYLTPVLFLFILASTTPFSGCTKDKIIHDTVTVRHDTTIIKHDTLVKTDSIYDVQDGLVAYYNFNGGSLKDSSGYNNHIIFNNATPTTDRFGNAGNAYLFNGSGSYMQIANSKSLNPDNITLFAIIKVNAFSTASCHVNQLLDKGYPDNTNGYYALRFSDNNACGPVVDSTHEGFQTGFGDNNPVPSAAYANPDSIPVRTGVWYTLTFTYDGIGSKFYINGVLKATQQKSVIFTANTNDLFLGRDGDTTYPYYFNGVIDEVRIYNRALPQGAVTQLSKLNK